MEVWVGLGASGGRLGGLLRLSWGAGEDKNDGTAITEATEESPTEAAAAEDAPTVAEVVVSRP